MPTSQIVMSFQKLLLPQTSRAEKIILMASTPNKIFKLKAPSQVKNHRVKFYGQSLCLPSQTRDLQIIIVEEKRHSVQNTKIRISVLHETIASLKMFPGKISSSHGDYVLYWQGSIITLEDGNFNSNVQINNAYEDEIDQRQEKKVSETHSQKHNQSYHQEYLRGNTKDSNSEKSSLSPSKGSQENLNKFGLRFAKKPSILTLPSSDQCVNTSEILSSRKLISLQDINEEQSEDRMRNSLHNCQQHHLLKNHENKLKRSKSHSVLQFIKNMKEPIVIGLVGGISGCLANINNFI